MKFEAVEIAILQWLKNAYKENLITKAFETHLKLQDPEVAKNMLRDYENEYLQSEVYISERTRQDMETFIKSESKKFYETIVQDTGFDFDVINITILMLKYEGYVEILKSNIGPEQCFLITPQGLTALRNIDS